MTPLEALQTAARCRKIGGKGVFAVKVSYKDRFGSLGVVSALEGLRCAGSVMIDHWVMSCLGFSRRIEHRCLESLLDSLSVEEVGLRFSAAPRNGPLQDFLAEFLGPPPWDSPRISRPVFVGHCQPLHHSLEGLTQ
jgi:hypothetical protein